MKIKGYYTLRCSDVIEDISIYNETLDELDGFEYEIKHQNVSGILTFKIADDEKQISQVKDFEKFNFPWCDNILIIEGSLMCENENPGFIIEKRIRDLFILISICKNGIVDYPAGELFSDKIHIHSCDSFVHSIDFVVLSAKKNKWPNLSSISIKESIMWWGNYYNSMDSISENKIGRAINAYSHLFNSSGGSDDPAKLFWALVGIEAIYVLGNSSLQEQVNKKTQIFLGERHEFKKRFSKMYDYRSRFVHGDLNFENKYFIETKKIEDHLSDFWSNRDFAISILVATFQKLIVENRHNLEFDFVIKE
ncbi:MAG TPA: hypothetical protein VK212_08055 [Lentimicrobium sp.]|nr:hypothetical protein [Lentimicrobium sp.]